MGKMIFYIGGFLSAVMVIVNFAVNQGQGFLLILRVEVATAVLFSVLFGAMTWFGFATGVLQKKNDEDYE